MFYKWIKNTNTNKTPVEVTKEGAFRLEVLILETFILMLIKNRTKNHGKNLIS